MKRQSGRGSSGNDRQEKQTGINGALPQLGRLMKQPDTEVKIIVASKESSLFPNKKGVAMQSSHSYRNNMTQKKDQVQSPQRRDCPSLPKNNTQSRQAYKSPPFEKKSHNGPAQPQRSNEDEQIDRIILKFQENQLPAYNPPQFYHLNWGSIHQQYQEPHQVHLGMFGKHYCSGQLEGAACGCCNGQCGPLDGQNCVRCMRLDQLRRGLRPGQLVNSDGSVCWVAAVHREEGLYSCGNMMSEEGDHCGEVTEVCYACFRLNRHIERYRRLLFQT